MANVTIIPEDYDGLKKEYLVLRKELDSVKQELYGCKRQLKVVEALQHEYQSEIEILQSEENAEKIKHEEKIAQLEENIANVRVKYSERIHSLETELTSKEDESEKLKTEIEFLKKNNAIEAPTENVNKLLDEIVDLRQANEILLENEEELKLSLEILQKNSFALEEALMEHKEEVSNLKESLVCKRDELMEANDLVQKLNDELFCLKNELESYKSKPLNAESKGNSLFAEVDDRRVYLQKTINAMKTEYISMKQERAKHLNIISHLRKENKTLCERWKIDIEEKEDDQEMVRKSYKDQIQILENLVEKYKQDLSAKPVIISTGTFSEIEFYQIMLNNKRKELEELREQLKSRGLTHTILSTTLQKANKEIRKWRLEATLKQCQLELQPGDSISKSAITKKVDEELGEKRIELKQTKKGPHLACKKEENHIIQLNLKTEEQAIVKKELGEIKTELKQDPIELNKNTEQVVIKNECIKDVITIDDSIEDVEIIEPIQDVTREKSDDSEVKKIPSILKEQKENAPKTDDIEKTGNVVDGKCCVREEESDVEENVKSDVSDDKENVSEKTSRKVTFCQNTVSPKVTDRSAMRKNCKRLVVPQAVFIPSE